MEEEKIVNHFRRDRAYFDDRTGEDIPMAEVVNLYNIIIKKDQLRIRQQELLLEKKVKNQAEIYEKRHSAATQYAAEKGEAYHKVLIFFIAIWLFIAVFCFVIIDFKKTVASFAFLIPFSVFLLSKIGWIPDAKAYKEACYHGKYPEKEEDKRKLDDLKAQLSSVRTENEVRRGGIDY